MGGSARSSRHVAAVALGLVLTGLPAPGAVGADTRPAAGASGRVMPLASEDRAVLTSLGREVAIGEPVAAPVVDPGRLALLRPGRWTYRVLTGPREGKTEVEHLASAARGRPGTDWTRTVGDEYVLEITGTPDGSLVMPRELVKGHGALVHFEPPLVYVLGGLRPGERRTAESRMTVYSAENPSFRRYSGRINSTTTYVGAYRVRTPAGAFEAALIRTDYTIEVFGFVSVHDVLHTMYAPGVGKVLEAERRRVTALRMPVSSLDTAKVLIAYAIEPDVVEAAAPPPIPRAQEAPRRRRRGGVRRRDGVPAA
jgi:hypothetical protein